MKRWTPVVVAPLCLLLLAQPAEAQDLDLQFVAGLSSATLGGNGSNADPPSGRNGLVAGAGLSASFTPNLAVGLQALYTAKGAVYDDGEWTYQHDYLELPLLLIASIPLGVASRVRPLLMAGPALGIKLGGKAVVDAGGTKVELDEDEWGGPPLSGTDLGFVLGGGVGVPAGPGQLLLVGRYVTGLRDTYDGSWAAGDFKNQSLQAMAGYSFPIGSVRR